MTDMTDMTERRQADARVAETLYDVLSTDDGDVNLTRAVADAAHALRLLGNADASTPMGALEAHGKAMIEAAENISGGLHDIADAIREAAA
jgi:hypothetical protein